MPISAAPMSTERKINAIAVQASSVTVRSCTVLPMAESKSTLRFSAKGSAAAAENLSRNWFATSVASGAPDEASQRYKPHDAYGVFTMRLQAMSVSSVSENMPPMTGTILSTVYFAVLKETPSIEAPAIPFERADAKEDDKEYPQQPFDDALQKVLPACPD